MHKLFLYTFILSNLSTEVLAYAPTQRDIYDAMGVERGEPSPIAVVIIILFFAIVGLSQLHDVFFNRIPGYFKKDEMDEKIRDIYLKVTIENLEHFKDFISENCDMGAIYNYYDRKNIHLQAWASDIYNYKNPEIYRYCSHKQALEAIEENSFTGFLCKLVSDIKITAIVDYDLIFGQIDIALRFAKCEINKKQVEVEMAELKSKIETRKELENEQNCEYKIEALREALDKIERDFGKKK